LQLGAGGDGFLPAAVDGQVRELAAGIDDLAAAQHMDVREDGTRSSADDAVGADRLDTAGADRDIGYETALHEELAAAQHGYAAGGAVLDGYQSAGLHGHAAGGAIVV